MKKETPDSQELAALTETFSRLGWGKEVPGMLFNWGKDSGVKFTCDDERFLLTIENKDNKRSTAVDLKSDERYPEFKHIRVARGVWLKDLVIEGYPVRMIEALNPDDIELDVEPTLVISLDNAVIKINRGGEISGEIKR